jgi:hypothetical protein
MSALFVFCAVVGGTILICQLVMTLVGFSHDMHLETDGDDLGEAVHDVASPDGHDAHGHHGSTWLFSVISIRTVVAATTFFGLGGLLAQSLQYGRAPQLVTGLVMGGIAMVGVHKLLQLFYRLNEDGTIKIQRAVGLSGTVYVPIPANRTGAGKIHLNLQNRLVEYAAVTANGEKLATGSKVRVVDVVGSDTLEVAPEDEPAETRAA